MRGTKRGGRLLLWFALLVCAAIGRPIWHTGCVRGAQAIYGGGSGVALMFNVYQNTQGSGNRAQILDHYGVRAAFFWAGYGRSRTRTCFLICTLPGMTSATTLQPQLPAKAGASVARGEIQRTDVILSEIIGQKPYLYAPPSGISIRKRWTRRAGRVFDHSLERRHPSDWRDQDAKLIQHAPLRPEGRRALLLIAPHARNRSGPAASSRACGQGFAIKPVSELLAGAKPK